MFLVITTPNNRDTSVDVIAPRFITDDPAKALTEARIAGNDALSEFVGHVLIYEIGVDERHDLHCATAEEDNYRNILVYRAWRRHHNDDWSEHFMGSMKTMEEFATALAS